VSGLFLLVFWLWLVTVCVTSYCFFCIDWRLGSKCVRFSLLCSEKTIPPLYKASINSQGYWAACLVLMPLACCWENYALCSSFLMLCQSERSDFKSTSNLSKYLVKSDLLNGLILIRSPLQMIIPFFPLRYFSRHSFGSNMRPWESTPLISTRN